MKVPTLEDPRDTRPISTTYSNLDVRTGLDSVARGMEQAGAGIGALASVQAEAAKKARLEGEATAEAMAVSDWERRSTIRTIGDANNPKAPPGFFQLHGVDAQAAAGDVRTKLDDDLEEVARGLPTPEQQAKFKQRMAPRLMAVGNAIEGHAGQERRVAAETASAGLADTLLRAIPTTPTPEFVAGQAAAYEQTVRALQRSPEEGDAKVAQWNERAAIEAMNVHLSTAEQDPEAAQVALDAFTPMLDAKAVRTYQAKIDDYRGDAVVLHAARAAAAGSVDADGWMQEGPALEAAQKYAEEHGLTAKQDEALQGKTALEVRRNQAAKKERYDSISSSIYQTVNERSWWGTPAADKALLNKVNPPLYRAFENEAIREAKQSKQTDAQNAKERHEADRLALLDFRTLEPKERADLKVGEWLVGRGVSKVGAAAINAEQTVVKGQIQKGEAMHETEFRADARAAANKVVRGKDAQKTYDAEATLAYQQFYAKNKRAPNREEANAEIANLLVNTKVPGRFYGTNEVPTFEARAKKRARARQLQAEGKSLADIAKALDAEGY